MEVLSFPYRGEHLMVGYSVDKSGSAAWRAPAFSIGLKAWTGAISLAGKDEAAAAHLIEGAVRERLAWHTLMAQLKSDADARVWGQASAATDLQP